MAPNGEHCERRIGALRPVLPIQVWRKPFPDLRFALTRSTFVPRHSRESGNPEGCQPRLGEVMMRLIL